MFKNINSSTLTLAMSALALVLSLYFGFSNKSKVAYVKVQELLNKYDGMQQARKEFDAKSEQWKSRIDTLKKEVEDYVKQNGGTFEAMPNDKKQVAVQKRDQALEYEQTLMNQAKTEEQKLTKQVLAKLDDFIKDYGKSKGYKVIFGATGDGGILYADEAIDITEEVIKAVNHAK